MHTVKRAIILAAGVGKRMWPITETTPKPMIKVNGVRMIDTVIEGLYANGIYEIYVVVGYLKERFYELVERYEDIHIIENSYYESCNNISSLYVAREYLEDAIVLDGDQIIYNNAILAKEFERSGYNAIRTDERTNEWLMQVDKKGIVTSCSRCGGTGGWQLFSISRWNAEDGKKLRRHLEEEFEEKHNNGIYWDDVVMFCHFDEYELGIRPMTVGDVVEVDCFDELVTLDDSYLLSGKE